MILLVTGTRHIDNVAEIERGVQHLLTSSPEFAALYPAGGMLVHGGARGIDSAARTWARNHRTRWEITVFPADWEQHGKAAGMIRNREMAEFCKNSGRPTFVLAFPHATLESRGTRGMIKICRELGLPVTEFPVPSLSEPDLTGVVDEVLREVE